ncbi:MAG: TerD family protein [Deltaproteobacteria bacterium]|jgi:tellurium resistance protein TerD|nr:TerD family protein [Deltaproteobacteria bacterium]
MGVVLVKGGNVSLTKESPGLTAVKAGLGWEAGRASGFEFDLDASAFLLRENGRVRSDEDFVFYHNLKAANGAVEHTGDDLTGGGDGKDNETIIIDLEKVPPDVKRISLTVSIYDAQPRRQNFGMVENAFIRVLNLEDQKEIARFDLSEDMSTETAMIFGEIYRHGDEWKFKAVAKGFTGGLSAMCAHFGVEVRE